MRVPRIYYGAGPVTLTLGYPASLHTYENESRGGSRVLGNLQSETLVRITHRFIELVLRFHETQYLAVEAWVAWCHANGMGPFNARLDSNDAATQAAFYLAEPDVGRKWKVNRDTEYHQALNIRTSWRRSTTAALYVPVS